MRIEGEGICINRATPVRGRNTPNITRTPKKDFVSLVAEFYAYQDVLFINKLSSVMKYEIH